MIIVNFLTLLLVLAGAINWGCWGFANYDFIADVFGSNTSVWARICYAAIGLCGVYNLRLFFIGRIYRKKLVTASVEEGEEDDGEEEYEEEEEFPPSDEEENH